MIDTKEKILKTALDLFAADGYEAVSVSTIAGRLGMAKSALYKHYKNKRDIFDSILKRMEELDCLRAEEYAVPSAPLEEMPDVYRQTALEDIKKFTIAQFEYWTEDEFASAFRKMLTLEQYRSEEMSCLYQQYLAGGPVGYMADLFDSICGTNNGRELALAYYGPMYLLYYVYDGAEDKSQVKEQLKAHLELFMENLKKTI